VEPLEVIDQGGGIAGVKVHQLVKSLGGDVLSDSEAWHVYTIANGLIERMDLKGSEMGSDPTPSQHSPDTSMRQGSYRERHADRRSRLSRSLRQDE
jgi:hypothetical protein